MTGKIKYILFLILILISARSFGQNSQVLYNMNLPQNHLLNPALRPSNSVYIGLPGLTGINLNVNNNFVNFSDIFMNGGVGDSLITFLHPDYNVDDFLDKIKDKNSLDAQASAQLFGLGFSAGKSTYIFFDINTRFEGNLVLPGDLFKLALIGNEQFVGDKIDLSSLTSWARVYHEFGIGFSRDFTSKLRIGVKAKILYGVADLSVDNRSLSIAVNDDYTHSLIADVTINSSDPLLIYNEADTSLTVDDNRLDKTSDLIEFLWGKSNSGLGLDLGATYDISDKLVVSASITDLGFIKWKKDIINLRAESNFTFNGFDIGDVVDGTKTFDELGQDMLDSLKNSLILTDSKSTYSTYLTMGVALGGSYNVTKSLTLGILSYSRFIGKQVKESLTLSANINLSNAFSTSLAYTMSNHRFDNLGAGLAFRAGICQFYMMSDRIPVMWNKIILEEGGTIPLPVSWNSVNLRIGMNLVFGNKVKKKDDKPMVIVE